MKCSTRVVCGNAVLTRKHTSWAFDWLKANRENNTDDSDHVTVLFLER